MDRHEAIKNAYKDLGGEATFYDGMITCSTLPGKAAVMENKKHLPGKSHLPLYGVGPVYGAVIIAVTAAAVIAGHSTLFEKGINKGLKIPSAVIGILLIIFGLYLWHGAVLRAKVDDGIVNNKLVTTGVYALVRNPIYSAFMLFCTGALLVSGNLFCYPLFFFYWILMTVLMKCTEEKWLKNLYGREYEEYCQRVNRCIPWLPKSGKGTCR